MRIMMVLGASAILASCAPTVDVPYFGKIPVEDLCGNYSSHCQPTVSRLWAQSDAIPFESAETILGWSYTTDLRSRDLCANITAPLFEQRGSNAFAGTVTTTERARVVAALGVDLREFIDRNFSALPDSLKAALQVKAEDAVKTAVEQRVNLRYRRVEMTTMGLSTQARPCLDALPVGTKVITGVSVISADGTWTSSRLREAANEFEASASYDELGLEGKVEYERQRDVALAGRFEPLHYVFAFSFIRKE
jgi:hypothetical protein